jgi:hypothetical protein
MAADERQPGSVRTGNDLLFGAGNVGDRAVFREQTTKRSAELIEQVKAGQRRAGENHDLGSCEGIFERRGGNIDCTVVEGLPDGRRATTPSRDMPRPGLHPLVQRASD